MSENIIEIKNINVSYGSNHVLKDINLNIKNKDFYTFLGPSGCGKTTLLRLIAGFEKSQSGELFIGGNEISHSNPWERDVGSLYGDTEYAKKAPLIKIDISLFSKQFPDVTQNVSVTPTFVLMSENDEVGRIVGYQNRDMFFWALSEYIPH